MSEMERRLEAAESELRALRQTVEAVASAQAAQVERTTASLLSVTNAVRQIASAHVDEATHNAKTFALTLLTMSTALSFDINAIILVLERELEKQREAGKPPADMIFTEQLLVWLRAAH